MHMNKFLDKMEKAIRRFSVLNLMKYIAIGMVVFYFISFLFSGKTINVFGQEEAFLNLLALNRTAIFHGQVWRLISFVFLPPASDVLFVLISIYFYYFIGTSLESHWGTSRFNLYYLLGMLGTIIAALISGGGTNLFLNYSLFFAFAALFPNIEFRLFFVIPVKVKYLAYFNAGFFAYSFVIGDWTYRAAILASLANFFLFFGEDFFSKTKRRWKTRKIRKNFRDQYK